MLSRRFACSLAAVLLLPAALTAQTTFATITGTVTDSTGAVIGSATVTATNVETNIVTTSQANEVGIYTLAQLKEGTYTVKARATGFKEFVAQNVVLISRDLRRLDIQLDVGSVETSVEVSAGATLIETETARLGDAKTAEVMKTLPLNTRGLWAFISLSPNVLQAGGGSSTIRFAGSRGNQSNWAIDGVTFSDGVDNTQIGPLANYIESFQEIKIDMANNTAEFGTIGQVTIVSKSGTNKFSGNIFDYYSTPWFRARDPFAIARPAGVGHTPGGSVGGPVFIPKIYNGKNKSFFFFSFETARGSAVNQLLNPTVPLEPWRGGNFSGVTQTIYDPNGGAPFPGNIIPANRINAVSQRIQDRFYPLPNRPAATLVSQNYQEMKQRPRDPSTYWTVRGDHRFSDKDMVFGRFTFQRAYNRTYEGNLPTIGRRIQQRDNRALAGSWTHTFRPTMLNEFRYGFALNNNPVEGPINGPSIVQELGLVGLAPNLPDISGILKVSWAGIGLTGITQPDYTRPGFRNFLQDFQDHISWFKGKHNMKFGVNMTRVEWDSLNANPNLFGSVTFSNRFTSLNQAAATGGHPYADFLLGIPTNTARAFPPVRVDRTRWQYDFYFNDDWKLSQRLTVNFGLRYELHNPWREEGGLTSMFDIGSGNIVVEDGALNKVSPLFPRNYVGIVEASTLGLPGRTLIRRDNNNIAPRIGLAWRPWGQDTVIRAGFGLFYDVVPRNLNQGAIPFVLNEPGHTNAAGNPTVIFPRVFPATGAAGPSTVGIPAAVNPNLKMPYSMQYNLTIEKQMWQTGFRVSYMGTNTRQGDFNYDFNSPIADTRAYVNKPRAFPNYPGISYFTNGAGHQYHALTAEAERYMAKGLYFQTSWSWARDIGDLNRGAGPEYAFDRRRERAVELDIPTHRFNMNWIYQLPFGKGQRYLGNAGRAVDLMVRGWEITGIYSYYSNQFLTPLWTGPDPTGTRFSPNATPPITTIRPNVLRDGNLPADQRSPARWFDASAFAAPSPGAFGTAARGLIKGPGVNVWHGGFIKNFIFAENAPRLRWELTATNFFNHPNYSNPAMDITALANVGVITGVGGVNGSATGDQPFARAFRTGLRLEW